MYRLRALGILAGVLLLLIGRPANSKPMELSESPVLRVLVVKEVSGDFQASGEVVAREETGRAAELRAPFVVPPGKSSVEVSFALPREGTWWFNVNGRGLFSRPKLATFPLESRRVVLEIRPLVKLKGRIVAPAGSPIEGREALVRWCALGSSEPWESVKVVLSAGQVEAEIPAGIWNLAVKLTGCASDRRESTVVSPGATMDLGTVSAVPGASFVGRVANRDSDAGRVPKETRITLSPAGEIPGASSLGDGIVLAKETRLSPMGEFQFAGMSAGRYNLRVYAPGFAREDRVVDLLADREVELRDPMLLAKPARLQIDLRPPLDPRGVPWAVELREKGEAGWPLGAGLTTKSSSGTAFFEGVRLKGEYIAVVRAGNGEAWRVQAITIDAPRTRLSLSIDSTQVAGRLTLGGEPLAAELVFGGRNAAPSITARSAEDGEFRAELPRASRWRVAVSSRAPRVSREVSVEVPEPKDGFPARIEIALPETGLKVRVVDTAGGPVATRCLVRLESVLTHETQTEQTDTGEAEVVGLEAGEWIVYAESPRAVSDRRTVTIEQDGHQEVTLTLAEKRLVKGVVVSSLGLPVPYARLQPLRWDSRADTFPPLVTTDALGRFKLQVPSEVNRLGLLVFAPGYAVTTALVPVRESVEVAVQVPNEGGRVQFSFDSAAYPPPRMPYVSDGTLTFLAMLLRSSGEIKVDFRDGRTFVEIPSYRPGPFGVCRSALGGASDVEAVGRDCAFGSVTPGRDVVLDLEKAR